MYCVCALAVIGHAYRVNCKSVMKINRAILLYNFFFIFYIQHYMDVEKWQPASWRQTNKKMDSDRFSL